MKIVIDCRYLGGSGIGRYLEYFLQTLDYSDKYYYVLWGNKDKISKYKANEYIYDDINPFNMKSMFSKAKKKINECDYLFTPNFIIPFGIKIKIISMIHDVLFFDMPEVNKNILEKVIKKYLMKRCCRISQNVLTVSKFSLERIKHFFPKYKNKYVYHLNGISDDFKNYKNTLTKKNQMIYVGNIKKQKGLKTLLEAYKLVDDIKLVIVGDDSNFRNGDEEIKELISKMDINFTGRVDDDKLKELVAESKFLIQPSLYEGFGYPPLEALYLGTKPIISDIEVFKEIYEGLPVEFFKVLDSQDLAKKIKETNPSFEFDKDKYNEKFSIEEVTKFIYSLIK